MRDILRMPRVTWKCYKVWQRNRDSYKQHYKLNLLGNLGEPFLYLIAMGYGIGAFLGELDGMPYLQYIAPGLVLSSTMFSATYECTYGTFLRMKYQKTYDAILATPLNIEEIVAGDILWGMTKGAISGMIMFIAVLTFGLVQSAWALFLPILILFVGLFFASMSMVVTSFAPHFEFFNYYLTLLITPMFFFSGIFFPLTNFPLWVKTTSEALPLTHAVRVARSMIMGTLSSDLWVSLLWLIIPSTFFFLLSLNLIRRRMIR